MAVKFVNFGAKHNTDVFIVSQASAPVWEDFVGKASKLHSALK